MPLLDEPLDQGRTGEACPSGNQHTHFRRPQRLTAPTPE